VKARSEQRRSAGRNSSAIIAAVSSRMSKAARTLWSLADADMAQDSSALTTETTRERVRRRTTGADYRAVSV